MGEVVQARVPQAAGGIWQQRAPDIYPPPWASAWGSDQYGLWADLSLQAGTQEPVTQRLRWIAAGEFTMGSPRYEIGRCEDEGDLHLVRIGSGFWLADTACTQALWQIVMHVNPAHFQLGNGGGPMHPVEQVSWLMVQEFLLKFSRLWPVGLSILATVPTEAEWEYCCRAGTQTPFFFGVNINSGQVNFNGSLGGTAEKNSEFRECTVPVKSLPPNAWGLFQMHGNVWEWCADQWQDFAEQPALPVAVDPWGLVMEELVAEKTVARVLRGGSWIDGARDARSANRFGLRPDGRGRNAGFRFALRPSVSLRG